MNLKKAGSIVSVLLFIGVLALKIFGGTSRVYPKICVNL
jgi:hypothetical protein